LTNVARRAADRIDAPLSKKQIERIVELLSRWKELADQLSGEGLRRYDVWPWAFTPHEIVLREPDNIPISRLSGHPHSSAGGATRR